jgi:death-on-curing family protein
MLSKKDIIDINQRFHEGILVNEGSLEYAAKSCARNKNWLRSAATFTRAIIIDHAFQDGNKRTALAAVMLIMEMNNVYFDIERLTFAMVEISRKNVSSINEIERYIKNGIRKE